MKKMLAFILAIALVFTFSGCGTKEAKKDIFALVDKNFDAIIKACKENDVDALTAINGITQVNIVDGYVIVYCEGAGIAPSSQDYGFYYSEEISPITVGCNLDIVCRSDGLTPEGEGFQCVVNGNTFYTEQINGNIFFYSNAY